MLIQIGQFFSFVQQLKFFILQESVLHSSQPQSHNQFYLLLFILYLNLIMEISKFNLQKNLTYQQKYLACKTIVNQIPLTNPTNQQLSLLQEFVYIFPFNNTYWIRYANFHSQSEKIDMQHKVISLARSVMCNCKSIQLWINYLDALKSSPKTHEQTYRSQLTRAIEQIGYDYNSYPLFKEYLNMHTNCHQIYQFFISNLIRSFRQIEQFYEKAITWFDNLSEEDARSIYSQIKNDPTAEIQKVKDTIRNNLQNAYNKSMEQAVPRKQFNQQIRINQYQPNNGLYKVWRQFLDKIRSYGNYEERIFTYQKALITQCDNQLFWEEFLLFLEHDCGNTSKVLQIFRNNQKFFKIFSQDLLYQWIQFEEKQNPSQARQLYLELQKNNRNQLITSKALDIHQTFADVDKKQGIFQCQSSLRYQFEYIPFQFGYNRTLDNRICVICSEGTLSLRRSY